MLSHDITGNAWAHHDIASALAASGFIVVAPTHDRDNAEDMRLLFTERELPMRALQLKAALGHVLSHPQIGAQADASRVGFLGFGLPSPAGLLLAGGELTPDGWDAYRKNGDSSNGSRSSSPWCSGYTAERMDALVASMRHSTVEKEEKRRMLGFATESHRKQLERSITSVTRSHQRQLRLARKQNIPQPPTALPLLPQLAPETSVNDARFKAFALVSPGFSMLFTPATLTKVNAPVLLVVAGQDAFLRPSDHAERFAGMLPGKPEYLAIAEATSASFLAPCTASDPARELAGICAGTDTEQRRIIHTRIVHHLRDFFHRCFDSPNTL
jgi:predicted dienelactone hydrolase